MKNGSCSATTVAGSAALPFVISTGAPKERSGEICGVSGPSLGMSSRPERTRISYFALLATSTCAALRRESRMQIINATGFHRKFGGAEWRDLVLSGPFLEIFSIGSC
jgi:hypothetical protein